MRFCFDLDGTICDTPCDSDGHNQRYWDSTPIPFMVETVNRLYDEGHYIIIMTARGRGSGKNWTELTKKSLDKWGVKYHELEPMFHKPNADIFIDDKGENVFDWILHQPQKKGIIAGAFDVIHPGYIRMFQDAKKYCNHLTIALHVDPNTERSHKLKPVQTAEEREEILRGLRNVDDVVFYDSEDEYLAMLESGKYDIRFLGDDYADGSYSGAGLGIPIIWLSRDHDYSSTRLKTLIFRSILPRKSENYD
jgi:glycerol-3-phosphate cytidylyltransferase